MYDQPDYESFISKLEQFQYKATLTITEAFYCTSRSKIYRELDFESLESESRRQYLILYEKNKFKCTSCVLT